MDINLVWNLKTKDNTGNYPTSRFNGIAILSELTGPCESNGSILRVNHPDIRIVIDIIISCHLLEEPSRIRILSRGLRLTDFVSSVLSALGIVNSKSGFSTEEEVFGKSNVFHIVITSYWPFLNCQALFPINLW